MMNPSSSRQPLLVVLLLLHILVMNDWVSKDYFVTSFTSSFVNTQLQSTTRQQYAFIRQQQQQLPTIQRLHIGITTCSSSSASMKRFSINDNNNQDEIGSIPFSSETKKQDNDNHTPVVLKNNRRRDIIRNAFGTGLLGFFMTMIPFLQQEPVYALVKGNAPPPKNGGSGSTGNKGACTNVEECQELAFIREQQQREQAEAEAVPILATSKGTRYRDIEVGGGGGTTSNGDNVVVVQVGDEISVYYKVLKLGKRSYDGISGEGTVIFSRGYGYEDDEKQSRQKSFNMIVGSQQNIPAMNDAVVNMKMNGIRRFNILPEMGWRKPGQLCDGGPGGKGAGGELRTDYVVVPTATMVDEEKCFDTSKQPFPTTYAQQRRMAQRFDQSLIMELEVIQIEKGKYL